MPTVVLFLKKSNPSACHKIAHFFKMIFPLGNLDTNLVKTMLLSVLPTFLWIFSDKYYCFDVISFQWGHNSRFFHRVGNTDFYINLSNNAENCGVSYIFTTLLLWHCIFALLISKKVFFGCFPKNYIFWLWQFHSSSTAESSISCATKGLKLNKYVVQLYKSRWSIKGLIFGYWKI